MLNLRNQRLLVIAPHPDDEVVGCGGLIQKIKSQNGKVFVLFLTNGTTKDFSQKKLSTQDTRKKEIENVAKYLKFDDYKIAFEGDEFHLKLDLLGQKKIMDVIERGSKLSIENLKPTILAYPSNTSYNQDHKITAHAAHASARPANPKDKHFINFVIKFEEPVDSWSVDLEESPSMYISLTKKEIDIKLNALKLYKSQIRDFPNLRSLKVIESLAILRGAQAGTNFAESYSPDRIIS